MNEFLVMNFTYLSRHQRTHLMQHVIAFTTGFSLLAASYCLAKYSKTTLIIVTTAMIKDPKATDPRWYHSPHPIALNKLTSPNVSDISWPCPEKYHMQVMAAMMNCCKQIRKATTQNRPNKNNHMAYLI
jgi:hypothetical protein